MTPTSAPVDFTPSQLFSLEKGVWKARKYVVGRRGGKGLDLFIYFSTLQAYEGHYLRGGTVQKQ